MTTRKVMSRYERLGSDTSLLTPPVLGAEMDVHTMDIDANTMGKQEQVRRFAADTEHRKDLILWVKWVVTGSLVVTFGILLFNLARGMVLSDTVLVALLTTTTANILGLAFIVLRGLFNVKE